MHYNKSTGQRSTSQIIITVFFVHHTKKSNLVQNKKFCGFQSQGCDYSLVHCKNRPVMVTVLKGYNQLQKVILT